MKKIALFILNLLVPVTGILAASSLIAFERNNAVWIANLDGTGVRKIGCWIDSENILFLSRAPKEKGRLNLSDVRQQQGLEAPH